MIKKLYAPWRTLYKRLHKTETNPKNCPFCEHPNPGNDEEHFIIKRFTHTKVMLNTYPYNGGHLLVVPNEHKATLHELDSETRAELMEIASLCTIILHREMACKSFNIGINIGGEAAGGSIPEHLHVHVLPRFLGDTNFLVTLADTKLISHDLPSLYKKLITAFKNNS